ncbi:MATE family efflux transporter [Vibrio ezurae]|uniref:Putative drug resistance transporter n=1 Tax=Vibrio ezurae NBRC 102218 TaxID=1219080 RepID=U3CA60_9VIBR|nr:MATE family efflux transporter [Vibrio ezurae]GAD78229.1 putative drug resistance transporter [Vibrio ezurae NBRC 102218]
MKNILKLALPLTLSQLIGMALVLTDVWMMSRISVADLAAGGLGASVYSFVFLVAGSIVGCVANLIAIAYGQSISRPEFGHQQIRFAVKGAVMLSLLLSTALTLSFSFAPHLLIEAKQSPEVVAVAMQYLNALKWTMLPTLLLLVLRGLTSTFGDVRSVMIMSIITVFINVPISYFMAFHLHWGIAGLGYGTALSAWIVLLGYGFWVFRQHKYQRFSPWKNTDEYSAKLLLPMLAMGGPIALAALLEHGLIYGGTLMAGSISVASLAIHQIMLQCLSFTWNINFGFAQASAILVGKEYGANNFAGINKIASKSFIAVTVLSLVIASAFAIWPEVIANLFQLDSGSSHELSNMLISVIWVVALCFVVDAWQLLAINLLRGMKIVVVPTIMTAIGYWVFGLPAAWFLMKSYGLAGIWGGIGIGLGVTGILLLTVLIFETRRVCSIRLVPAV